MTLHLSSSRQPAARDLSEASRYSDIRYVKMVRPSLIHSNRARPFPSDIDVLIAPLAFTPSLSRKREVEVDQLLARGDNVLRRAYSQLRDTLMLVTRFASPTIRWKGELVTTFYRDALAEARSSPAREARWRRLIIATESLSRDLDRCARLTPNDARSRAHDALARIRIVDETADLLPDKALPTAVFCGDRT